MKPAFSVCAFQTLVGALAHLVGTTTHILENRECVRKRTDVRRRNAWLAPDASGRQLRHGEQAQDEQRDERRKENNETHPEQNRQHDAVAVTDRLDRRAEAAPGSAFSSLSAPPHRPMAVGSVRCTHRLLTETPPLT